MFKILFLTLIATLYSSKSLAVTPSSLYYAKASLSLEKMLKLDNSKVSEQKSTFSPAIGVGVGYHLDEDVRVELAIDYTKLDFKSPKGNDKNYVIYTNVSHVHLNSVMLSAYKDLYQTHNVKFFLGAGLGYARIHEKACTEVSLLTALMTKSKIHNVIARKLTHNMAYSISIGSSLQLAEGVVMDLSYNWKDFGKTASKKINEKFSFAEKHYRGHATTAGIRFYI